MGNNETGAPLGTVTWEEAVQELRDDPSQAALVRDAYYDDPLSEAAERYRQSAEWAAVRGLLGTSRGRALEIGAGRGIASYALAREGFAVTAIEPDPSLVVGAGAIRSLAADTGTAIEVVQAVGEHLPMPEATFDVVFARAVLHHAKDLRAACREFAKVLKPGGRLIAVREHVISRTEDLQAFHDIHPLHHRYGGEHAYLLSEYQAAIENAGLKIVKTIGPLESPINYAPHDRRSLRQEIARKLAFGTPLHAPIATMMALPMVERVIMALAARVDHRPGRLFSFVAEKPAG